MKPSKKTVKRSYSFLGFYRKYCEADIYEMLRLKKLIYHHTAIKKIEEKLFFCEFCGNTAMTVLFKEPDVLDYFSQWMDKDRELEQDEDKNYLEN